MINRTEADPRAWFKVIEYAAYIHNLLARKTNTWKMPLEEATRESQHFRMLGIYLLAESPLPLI